MEVFALTTFEEWLSGLRNRKDALRISARILRIEQGNFGDHKSVGGGVSELRFSFGAGYRVYYTIREGTVCILLGGGTKQRQKKDIEAAQALASRV